MQYQCTYTGGNGVPKDHGIWEVKKTEKIITLEKGEEKYRIPLNNSGKHCIFLWEENDFTVYLNRSGQPSYFEPISLE